MAKEAETLSGASSTLAGGERAEVTLLSSCRAKRLLALDNSHTLGLVESGGDSTSGVGAGLGAGPRYTQRGSSGSSLGLASQMSGRWKEPGGRASSNNSSGSQSGAIIILARPIRGSVTENRQWEEPQGHLERKTPADTKHHFLSGIITLDQPTT